MFAPRKKCHQTVRCRRGDFIFRASRRRPHQPPQRRQPALKGHARVPVAHILIKIEFRKSRDDDNFSREIAPVERGAFQHLGKLETGEGAGNLDLPV